MTFQLRLLSRFRLLGPDGNEIIVSSKKLQVLIAAIEIAGGKPVSRSDLVALLWSDRAQSQARNSLRQALTTLRQLTGSTDRPVFNIDADWISVDKHQVKSDVQTLLHPDEVPGMDQTIPTGEFLSGLGLRDEQIEIWLRDQRLRFHERMVGLLIKRISGHFGAGQVTDAIAQTRRLLAIEPANEWAHRMAMLGHARSGDRSSALQQYEICKQRLRSDFGITPEAATVDLREKIKAADPGSSGLPFLQESPADPTSPCLTPPADRPSIAVMPFDALSGQKGEGDFADALAKSITSALARFSDLLVIASYSTFAYKGTATPLTEIRRNLGVRYIVEGSVQFLADRLRVTAQLIDTQTQGHLWSERYDRAASDIFAVQDDVTERVVGSIANGYGGQIRKAWQATARQANPRHFQAFDYFMRGLKHGEVYDFKQSEAAIRNFKKAIEIDPTFAKPMAKLAWVYILDAVEAWGDDYDAAFSKGYQTALDAMKLDPHEPWCHWVMGACLFYQGEQERGIAMLEKAHHLNPNDADILFDLGYYKSYYGLHEDSVAHAHKALRLNPHYPVWYPMELVQIYFDARRYDDAIAAYRRIPDNGSATVELFAAASHAALGQGDEAAKTIAKALVLDPEASVTSWTSVRMSPYRLESDRQHFATNLQLAGLRE